MDAINVLPFGTVVRIIGGAKELIGYTAVVTGSNTFELDLQGIQYTPDLLIYDLAFISNDHTEYHFCFAKDVQVRNAANHSKLNRKAVTA